MDRVPTFESDYYGAKRRMPDVISSENSRNAGRVALARGDLYTAYQRTSTAVKSPEIQGFERETFANLGMHARVATLFLPPAAERAVAKMDELDIHVPGAPKWKKDQYELLFNPVRSAVSYGSKDIMDRLTGVAVGLSGIPWAMVSESKWFVNFPDRDPEHGFIWRSKVRAKLVQRNLCAVVANLTGCKKFADKAVR